MGLMGHEGGRILRLLGGERGAVVVPVPVMGVVVGRFFWF